MKEIALLPQMRQLWRAIKLFGVPITHPYIQNLTKFDLDFIDWSSAYDNPKFKEKMQNTVYDESFEDFWNGDADVNGQDVSSNTEEDLVDVPTKLPEVLKTFKHFIPTDFVLNKLPTQEHSTDDDEFEVIENLENENLKDDWEVI